MDLAICAKLQALTIADELTSTNHKVARVRNKPSTAYKHNGHDICLELFLKIHGIGRERLSNLQKHTIENGLALRQKKSGGRNRLAVSYDQHVAIYTFLTNAAEKYGVKLPGRIAGEYFNFYGKSLVCESLAMYVWHNDDMSGRQGYWEYCGTMFHFVCLK